MIGFLSAGYTFPHAIDNQSQLDQYLPKLRWKSQG